MGDGSNSSSNRPAWLQQYDLVGKIGEGTYGLVFLANEQAPFQQGQLLREISHENVVKLVNVHINHVDMSLYLAFDYAEHDHYIIETFIKSEKKDKAELPSNMV
ncbi:hypothetical protein AAC387_Pa06g2036 [Persea americana]